MEERESHCRKLEIRNEDLEMEHRAMSEKKKAAELKMSGRWPLDGTKAPNSSDCTSLSHRPHTGTVMHVSWALILHPPCMQDGIAAVQHQLLLRGIMTCLAGLLVETM